MSRILEQSHHSALALCTRRSTLSITFADSTVMNLATGDVEVANTVFLGKLAPVDELNLELTAKTNGVNFKISNAKLEIGQQLINTTDILSGSAASLGCYFRNPLTNAEWHHVKMLGTVQVGKITREWVDVFFESVTNKNYQGASIASLFPDAEIPAAEIPAPPAPIYNDIGGGLIGGGGGGLIGGGGGGFIGGDFVTRDFEYLYGKFDTGRYVVPEMLVL